MDVQELLFYIVVGIMIGAVIILVADKLLVNLVKANVYVKPGGVSSNSGGGGGLGTGGSGGGSQTCPDGTAFDQCSSTKPEYCNDQGHFIDGCGGTYNCGCPNPTDTCNADGSCTPICSCGSWTNGACGTGGCASNQRQQTRTCTPSGCTPSDGLGTSQCVADTTCTASSACDSTCKSNTYNYASGTCEAGTSTNTNLAVIPDDWELTYGTGPQIIYLDTSVEHTSGNPSIELEPHTSADVNTARECDGTWYDIKPGDHIVASCWMKIDLLPSGYQAETYAGARIGIDFYSTYFSGRNGQLSGTKFWQNYFAALGGDESLGYVHWGTPGWTQKTLDFIVPTTIDNDDGKNYVPTSFVVWMQVWSSTYGATEQGNAWFSDCELYINPTSSTSGSCQSGETSIGQDGCSSNNLCCCSGTAQKCSDGTAYGLCNTTNKPKYCSSGTLINNCSYCGCPSGQSCNTPSQTPSFSIRGADVSLDAFFNNNPDYQPNAWQQLKDLNINLIRLFIGTQDDVAGFSLNTSANWAQNLNAFLTTASSNGMLVEFSEMGSSWGPNLLLGIVPYPSTNPRIGTGYDPWNGATQVGTPIADAKVMIDKLAGNNALGHDFITDPRIYGWSTSNEPDLTDSAALTWNTQLLDYIRSKGGKAWVANPYFTNNGYGWNVTSVIQNLGSHMNMIETHNYGEWEYVNYFNYGTKSYGSWNSLYDYMYYTYKNTLAEAASSGFTPDQVFVGEYGCWLGYGTNEGLTQGVTFTAQDRINIYTAILDAARDAGIKNICLHIMFSETGNTPNYGIVKDPASGTGYWDNNLANIIRTAYSSTTTNACYTPASTCPDGTAPGYCSSNKPQYCDNNGNLQSNYCYGPDKIVGTADDCGCSSGTCQSDGSCAASTCSCGSWTNGACGSGGCSSNQRQQTRTCTPSGCTPSDGLGTSQCVADTTCTASSACDSTCKSNTYNYGSGTCRAGTSNTNMCAIPNGWEGGSGLTNGGQFMHNGAGARCFLDTSVEHTSGSSSIRCDGPALSTNKWREVDCNAYPGGWITGITPGTHIYMSAWIKTNPSTIGEASGPGYFAGAIIGIDLFGDNGGMTRIWEVCPSQLGGIATTFTGRPDYNNYAFVPYGTSTWVQRTIDFIIPSKTFTTDSEGNSLSQPQTVTAIIPWVTVDPEYPSQEAGSAWFADAQLYINPSSGTCQSSESSIGQDGCSSNNLCCCSGTAQVSQYKLTVDTSVDLTGDSAPSVPVYIDGSLKGNTNASGELVIQLSSGSHTISVGQTSRQFSHFWDHDCDSTNAGYWLDTASNPYSFTLTRDREITALYLTFTNITNSAGSAGFNYDGSTISGNLLDEKGNAIISGPGGYHPVCENPANVNSRAINRNVTLYYSTNSGTTWSSIATVDSSTAGSWSRLFSCPSGLNRLRATYTTTSSNWYYNATSVVISASCSSSTPSLLDYSRKVIGTELDYWTDYVDLFESDYGYDRTQAIDHMVDMIYASGFNHIRHGFIADDLDDDVILETSKRAHQLGMTISLQTIFLTAPVDWGGTGVSSDEQMVRAILNINGEGDAWRNDLVQAVKYYNVDGIDVMNEPMDWNWYVSNAGSWFTSYSSMSNENAYYSAYHTWLLNTITALKSANPNLLIIIDSMPFYDTTTWAKSYMITGSDIAYSVHDYYSYDCTYPPSYEQWALDYWNGNANAKTEMYAGYDASLQGPLINAGGKVWQEELGGCWSNPNYQQYYMDAIQYDISRGCRYNIFSYTPYPRSTTGLITSDWTALNSYGVWVTNYIKSSG